MVIKGDTRSLDNGSYLLETSVLRPDLLETVQQQHFSRSGGAGREAATVLLAWVVYSFLT